MPQLKKLYYDKYGKLQKGPNKRVVKTVEIYCGTSDQSESSESECDGAKGNPVFKPGEWESRLRSRSPSQVIGQLQTASTSREARSMSRPRNGVGLNDTHIGQPPQSPQQSADREREQGDVESINASVSQMGEQPPMNKYEEFARDLLRPYKVGVEVYGGVTPSKQTFTGHGGYCHDKTRLGVAEHAILDRRQDRERKIREMKRLQRNQPHVTDRYVFACCKAVRRYLENFHQLYAAKGNTTRDRVTTFQEGGDPVEEEAKLREVLDGARISPETMAMVYHTAMRCAAMRVVDSNRKQSQWVLPPVAIVKDENIGLLLNGQWQADLDRNVAVTREYLPVIGEKINLKSMMIPLHIDREGWVCVDVENKDGGIATVTAPGWRANHHEDRIVAVTQEVMRRVRLAWEGRPLRNPQTYEIEWVHESRGMYQKRDNGAAAALTIWRRFVHNSQEHVMLSDANYMRLQRDCLHTNLQVQSEAIRIMPMEEKGITGVPLNQPKRYVGAGVYFSNRNEARLPEEGSVDQTRDNRRRDHKRKDKAIRRRE